jgi:hypothetical protein
MAARSTAVGIARPLTGLGGSSRSYRASLPDPGLELSGQRMIGHSRLSDLGVQVTDRFFSNLGRRSLSVTFKDPCGALKQRLLPLMDHRPMHAVFGGQFRNRALSLHSFQSNPRLERRIMVPAFRNVCSPRSWRPADVRS